MRKISRALSFILVIIISLTAMRVEALADTIVTIDIDSTYQTIDGFGASYTWYGDWLTTNVNAETGYDWIFNDTEFNILRFRDLNHVGDEYQTALDGYQAYYSYYSAAVKRGIEPIVLVTSWGQYDRDLDFVAFTELDDNGYSYYTLAKDENGEYMYDELAQFCVESVQLFFDAGIPVDYFSISNETELQGLQIDENGNARDEAGFYFGADEDEYHCAYWKAHLAVYEAFQEAFGEYAPSITGAEVMADTASRLEAYITPLIENGGADTFEVIAHHLYGSQNTPSSYSDVADLYYGDYTLWQTEWYTNDYITHAEKMANEFIYEGISAYLYWNGVWIADTGNCLIEIDSSSENASISRNGNHYIMMHFSKYVKSGYKRVDVENDSDSVIVAFKAPDDSRLVVIVVNNTDEDDEITFDLGDVTINDSFGYQTVGNENRFKYSYWNEVTYSEVRNYIPALSVTTFVIDMPADPDYVEAATEKTVNPFVKTQSDSEVDVYMIVVIVLAVVAVVVVAIVLIAPTKKKKANTADGSNNE